MTKDCGEVGYQECGIRANKAADIATWINGAQNGIPWADEIDNFDAREKPPHAIRSDSTSLLGSNNRYIKNLIL